MYSLAELIYVSRRAMPIPIFMGRKLSLSSESFKVSSAQLWY